MRIFLFFTVMFMSFSAGAFFVHYRPFQFEEFTTAKDVQKNDIGDIGKFDVYSKIEFSELETKLIYINDNSDIVRNDARKLIVNNNVKIIYRRFDENNFIIHSELYGVRTKNLLTKSIKNNKKCLNIYIHGHDNNPFEFDYFRRFLHSSIKINCDTLTMSPIGFGLNEGNSNYPGYANEITLNKDEAKNHFYYSYYYGKYDPLSLFISNHYKVIDDLSKYYSKISITGISGGGWYTSWLSSLLPQIDLTVIYAGSMPLKYHYANNDGDFPAGDWEQTGSKIYKSYDYWELYKLTILDKFNKNNRNSYLIYNDNDPCCFRDPFASNVKYLMDKIKTRMPEVIIVNSSEHKIDNKLIEDIYFKNGFN